MMKPVKVFLLTSRRRGSMYGVGTYISQLSDALNPQDIELTIIYLHSECQEVNFDRNSAAYSQMFIPAIPLSGPDDVDNYHTSVIYLLREYIDSGEECVFHLNFITGIKFLTDLKEAFKCRIAFTFHFTEWSFLLLGNYQKLYDILSKDESALSDFEAGLKESVQKETMFLQHCDKIIFVAEHSYRNLRKLYDIADEKCTVIYNSLRDEYRHIPDEARRSLRNKYYFSPHDSLIVFAGRLDEVKGLEYLIKAFQELLKRSMNVRLIIAGEGNFTQWLDASKYAWSKISFTGKLSKEDLYEIYSIADIGVVCSLHEEFGYVALEMIMHKLPVIVSDTGGLAEIIEDNVSGLKIPVTSNGDMLQINATELADKLAFLIDGHDYAGKLADNGRRRFLDKFELSGFSTNMINLYRKLLTSDI